MFSLNTYCYPLIMSIMSFLMYPWYLSCAYACNRCTGRSDTTGIRGTERGVTAANTGGLGGATFRRSARRGHRWVPGPSFMQLCERQAQSIISLLISEMQLKYYCYIYCCIKFRCWMKTLTALVIQSLSRYWYPESYVAQARVVLSPA
jgi:hypothetical protein